MLSKIQRDMKGITLIALVITIIVLLILSEVTINIFIVTYGVNETQEKYLKSWEYA